MNMKIICHKFIAFVNGGIHVLEAVGRRYVKKLLSFEIEKIDEDSLSKNTRRWHVNYD